MPNSTYRKLNGGVPSDRPLECNLFPISVASPSPCSFGCTSSKLWPKDRAHLPATTHQCRTRYRAHVLPEGPTLCVAWKLPINLDVSRRKQASLNSSAYASGGRFEILMCEQLRAISRCGLPSPSLYYPNRCFYKGSFSFTHRPPCILPSPTSPISCQI